MKGYSGINIATWRMDGLILQGGGVGTSRDEVQIDVSRRLTSAASDPLGPRSDPCAAHTGLWAGTCNWHWTGTWCRVDGGDSLVHPLGFRRVEGFEDDAWPYSVAPAGLATLQRHLHLVRRELVQVRTTTG
jgi:hypothetical protein